jgi:hypothetical protein
MMAGMIRTAFTLYRIVVVVAARGNYTNYLLLYCTYYVFYERPIVPPR